MIWLKNMRVLVAFAILVAVMSLIACGGGSDDSSSSMVQPTAVPVPTAGPEPTIAPKATAVPCQIQSCVNMIPGIVVTIINGPDSIVFCLRPLSPGKAC